MGFEKPMSLGFYLYIGITPLCLYNSAAGGQMQAAEIHKLFRLYPCK